MNASEGRLVVERRVSARPETIFSFFSDRDRWVQWQGVDAEIDLRPGGIFRVNVTGDGYASGRFVEVVPDRKVAFTWGWEDPARGLPPGSSTVEVDLIPDGDGTLLRLTHSGLPLDLVDTHRYGWTNYTERLAAVAEGRDPGSDPLREGTG
ncbi:MAG: SRPBCC family protein [Actinomycetota bacterium]